MSYTCQIMITDNIIIIVRIYNTYKKATQNLQRKINKWTYKLKHKLFKLMINV